jgi:hypothetical protein
MRIFCPNLISEAIYIGGISTSDGTTFTRNHSFGVAGKNSWLNEQGGNVGIGTTNPTSKLHIVGDSIFNGQISSTGAMAIGMTPAPFWNARFTDYSDGSGVYIGSVQAGGYKYISGESYYNNSSFWHSNTTTSTAIGLGDGILRFYTDSGLTANTNFIPSERMRITSDGKVGIGTTSPSAKLDVNGNTIITGSLNVSANITCLSLTETSTEAVKYNIIPLTSQLDNVLKLKPVSFNYKTNDKHSIGLIAEDVSKVYPEFTSDNNDSISYGKITSVLIQSIKELKTIIDNQQKQIENLIDKLK